METVNNLHLLNDMNIKVVHRFSFILDTGECDSAFKFVFPLELMN